MHRVFLQASSDDVPDAGGGGVNGRSTWSGHVEAARSAQAAAHMATLIERLGDDEPLKSDGDDSVPPTREDLQP